MKLFEIFDHAHANGSLYGDTYDDFRRHHLDRRLFQDSVDHVRASERKPRKVKPSRSGSSPHPYRGRMVGENQEKDHPLAKFWHMVTGYEWTPGMTGPMQKALNRQASQKERMKSFMAQHPEHADTMLQMFKDFKAHQDSYWDGDDVPKPKMSDYLPELDGE